MDKKLLNDHRTYIAKVLDGGGKVLCFLTPCCREVMESTVPQNEGETWDSLCTCPHCGALFMKWCETDKINTAMPNRLTRAKRA